ncbi:hypothetical protein K3495_g2196 [Podosphaera aphanis]|nr:hypothetical protein K3495_g2196 [Podosphaera aphanis]
MRHPQPQGSACGEKARPPKPSLSGSRRVTATPPTSAQSGKECGGAAEPTRERRRRSGHPKALVSMIEREPRWDHSDPIWVICALPSQVLRISLLGRHSYHSGASNVVEEKAHPGLVITKSGAREVVESTSRSGRETTPDSQNLPATLRQYLNDDPIPKPFKYLRYFPSQSMLDN